MIRYTPNTAHEHIQTNKHTSTRTYAHTRCPSVSNAGSRMCSSVRKDTRLQCFRIRQNERPLRSLFVAVRKKHWRLRSSCEQFRIRPLRAKRLASRNALCLPVSERYCVCVFTRWVGEPETLTLTNTDCYKANAMYDPVDDISGQGRTKETATQCQSRCKSVAACAYFSRWSNGGCHLSSSKAKSKEESGVVSGPRSCGMLGSR